MEEQLRLFDPTHYKDLNGKWNIEIEMTVEELDQINKAANTLGMEMNDYISYAIEKEVKKYFCKTCKKFREDSGNICNHCGEIDL